MAKKKGLGGFDFNKVPWTPIIVGALGIYIISKFKNLNPFASNKLVDDAQSNAASPYSPWNIHYTDGHSYHGLTSASANQLASDIYNAAGYFSNDYNAIVAAIKKLSYKSQVSDLVKTFSKNYNEDLFNWLSGGFNPNPENTQMINTVVAYVNNLPTGIIK